MLHLMQLKLVIPSALSLHHLNNPPRANEMREGVIDVHLGNFQDHVI